MVISTFSKNAAEPCSSLNYDSIIVNCRVQIINIIKDFFKLNMAEPYADEYFWPIVKNLIKDEHGVESLHREDLYRVFGGRVSAASEVLEYLKSEGEVNKQLDVIQLIFSLFNTMEAELARAGYRIIYRAGTAIEHLNKRFSENCIGYKFEGNQIIRIDNQLLYSNITKEVFVFLSDPLYRSINDEYIKAHQHFRSGNYMDCIVNSAKSFESTMKIICDQKGYAYQQSDTASKLLNVLYGNNYIPSYLQTGISALRTVLETISVIRNKTSAHGTGSAPVTVDENLAGYVLNVTGSNIKFLLSLL